MKKGMGRGPEPVENDMVKVRPTRPVNAIGELADIMCPNDRPIGVRRCNSLNQPVIQAAGNERGMGGGIDKKEIPMVPSGGATEECVEGRDWTDQRIRKGRKRYGRWWGASSLILIKEPGHHWQGNRSDEVNNQTALEMSQLRAAIPRVKKGLETNKKWYELTNRNQMTERDLKVLAIKDYQKQNEHT